MVMIGLNAKSDEIFITFIDTKFDDVAMFPLDDYNCELLNSLTDDVITGKRPSR